MDKDESKIGDAIDIVDEYHKYVPLKPDGSPLTLPLHADGLSCERVNDAQNARINGNTKWLQLQGLFPNIQEWHKRCLLLQVRPVICDILYDQVWFLINLLINVCIKMIVKKIKTMCFYFRTYMMNCTQAKAQEK